MTRAEAIEEMARALAECREISSWPDLSSNMQEHYKWCATAALSAAQPHIQAERERVREALNWAYTGDGLDEAALLIQSVLSPMNLSSDTSPRHDVQVAVRALVDRIRSRAIDIGDAGDE